VNLIIVSQIVKPPTETLPLRFLTMVSKGELSLSVLIEVSETEKDIYYKYMKDRGLMDFVEDFILPRYREEGIRLDTSLSYPKTIIVKAITFENVINLSGQIKNLSLLSNRLGNKTEFSEFSERLYRNLGRKIN
jgi:hypothetical protein